MAQGLFNCTAHGAARNISRADFAGFQRKSIHINGQECDIVVEGREVPWAEDITLVKSRNPATDTGATAELVPSSLDMYRVTAPQVCHLTPEQSVLSIQMLEPSQGFLLSRHRILGEPSPGLCIADVYGTFGMSGSPLVGIVPTVKTHLTPT